MSCFVSPALIASVAHLPQLSEAAFSAAPHAADAVFQAMRGFLALKSLSLHLINIRHNLYVDSEPDEDDSDKKAQKPANSSSAPLLLPELTALAITAHSTATDFSALERFQLPKLRHLELDAPSSAVHALLPNCSSAVAMRLDLRERCAAQLSGTSRIFNLQALELFADNLLHLESWIPFVLMQCATVDRLSIRSSDHGATKHKQLCKQTWSSASVAGLTSLELSLSTFDQAVSQSSATFVGNMLESNASLTKVYVRSPPTATKKHKEAKLLRDEFRKTVKQLAPSRHEANSISFVHFRRRSMFAS